jgi:protein-S-isoprenylcysteine O-methyltransferase Ste14
MPEFQIGLWNAWISVIYALLITSVLPFLVNREAAKRMYASFPLNKTEKIATTIDWILLIAFVVYSFFLPFKLHSIWFYAGLSVILLGEIMVTASVLNFLTAPINKPITKGIYKISRNPMHIGLCLLYLGVGIACVSWIVLLYFLIHLPLFHIETLAEERFLLEKHGSAYREFL